MTIFNALFGDGSKSRLKKFDKIKDNINSLEESLVQLTDLELKNKTLEFKDRLAKGETLDAILPEAFAVVREASKRTLKQRHFDVQLIGGIVLHNHAISEMRTGEGKTLVATLPTYLNALEGKGVHVITVNDYLARRDAAWMGQVYSFLGLTVSVVNSNTSYIYDENFKNLTEAEKNKDQKDQDEKGAYKVVYDFLKPCSRKEAYNTDITYGTNSEFGFDYLRDNLEYNKNNLRQRDLNYAVIDEVDSILIDEARTPLIISSNHKDSDELYLTCSGIAKKLQKDKDYTVDEKMRSISITEEGINKVEKLLNIKNLYTEEGVKFVHHIETAIRAEAIYKIDVDYVVKEDEIVIVDTFTGRLQPGRRWSEGLHQAIEAKESVKIKEETKTFASITYQNYFRLYKKISGMTGTALTSKEEFMKVYGLDVLSIPTNKKVERIDNDDFIFKNEIGKFKALARKVKEINKTGQPVLIGTASIEKNEVLSEFLKKEGVKHEVLNAKNHEREAEIIAQAGRVGAVTIATNMAGRGVDIKLGGVPMVEEETKKVKDLGGLFVIGTERHEARRIDNQLRGRSGRQGDKGETQFYVSVEDNLMRVFAGPMIQTLMNKMDIADDEPIRHKMISRSLETAQKKIEGFNFDSRKQVLSYDDVLNTQRKAIYEKRRKILVGELADFKILFREVVGQEDATQNIIEEKIKLVSEEVFYNIAKNITIQTLDMLWVEHLEAMDYIRNSVGLRAYGQRDPLVEYKKEAIRIYKNLNENLKNNIINVIKTIGIVNNEGQENKKLEETKEQALEIVNNAPNNSSTVNNKITGDKKEINRNDPCPCGSGKKYKKCHGK